MHKAFRDFIVDSDRYKEVWEEAVEAILKEDYRKWDARWAMLSRGARSGRGQEAAPQAGVQREERGPAVAAPDRASAPGCGPRARRSGCCRRGRCSCRSVWANWNRSWRRRRTGPGTPRSCCWRTTSWAGSGTSRQPTARKMRTRTREFLFAAPAPAIASYVHAAHPYLDTDPAFLSALFRPYSNAAAGR